MLPPSSSTARETIDCNKLSRSNWEASSRPICRSASNWAPRSCSACSVCIRSLMSLTYSMMPATLPSAAVRGKAESSIQPA